MSHDEARERGEKDFPWWRALCLLGALVLPALIARPQQSPAPPADQKKPTSLPKTRSKLTSHVILMTIDGLSADDASRSETLARMRAKGAFASAVESVYPTLTSPAHTTIASGLRPAEHGITADHPFDEGSGRASLVRHAKSKEIKGETLWDAARRGGLVTAAIGYPLTSGAAINYNLAPENDQAEPGGSTSALAREMALALGRAEVRIEYTRDDPAVDAAQDGLRAAVASQLITKYQPHLLAVNFISLDSTQRSFGPGSKEAREALRRIDELMGKILDANDRAHPDGDATVLVASTYGMLKAEREFRPNVALAKKGLLIVDRDRAVASWRAVASSSGGSAAIIARDPKDEQLVAELLKLFLEIHERPDSPIWRIVTRREADRLGADPRAAFFLEAAPGFVMSNRSDGGLTGKTAIRGASGYLPQRSEARAALVIDGRGIKSGARIEYARLIDIAPTLARLLGLEMATTRGKVMTGVIADEQDQSQRP